ncbi:efflux RND transporter periplasmic adaptor subunit [Budviciaceae bacterium BWR-B9]|uniref:Efflux RND transporter periplasmic adaptor subunit n=1 Tax=Limnobaculum allomyrinae TaxID=2791986 RepID=A0ABS1IN03_9GAMM|nr:MULTISPECIES: efflux RND transporter periplasmic adaptor subunit [Limnobaculum]MBK5143124.1 efflux RND transporter periplasmic adaptor subunit [Limnobaculum allomyrinae]MBV7691013.1 efflux RND transporter periplasmic adaptor subunit [Limnobaculum sp. M2-1]
MDNSRFLTWMVAIIICALSPIEMALAEQADTLRPEKTALTVTTMSPKMMEWDNTLLATGNIVAWQEASVSTEASGLSITRVLVDVGDKVVKGQLLAELQNHTLESELAQARAELVQAIAQREEARADAERARKLQKSAALSAQQITQYLITAKIAEARVKAHEAKVSSAEFRVSQTRIVAPDDGTITIRQATLGHVVSPGDILFKLNRQDRMEWRGELPSNELAQIQPGQRVKITINGQDAVTGLVRQVAPTVDQKTRNGLVYVDLPDSSSIRAGMFASGNITVSQRKGLAVPLSALLLQDGAAYVSRVGPDNKIEQTKVTAGQQVNGWVPILNGLQPDDTLVVSGVSFLSEGDSVRIASHQAD